MEEKRAADVAVTKQIKMKKLLILFFLWGTIHSLTAQDNNPNTYVKKVLENTEIELLGSLYNQTGSHAAVTGGEGTESLSDAASTIVVSIPLTDDNVLTVDAGISAYTSASSSNINPFDGKSKASPWVESSGASKSDALVYVHPTFSHSSKDRNQVVNGNVALSKEHDYFSLGFGGSYTKLFNEKNTEFGISGQVYLDKYTPQYPYELRDGFSNVFASEITGTGTYTPKYKPFIQLKRNSYSVSLNFSQIINRRLQASLSIDLVFQEGLLSTPHQRVYFADKADFFVENFQLADDVERLPFYRYKLPIGARVSYAINEAITFRGYARYYTDDWGLKATTASFELPLKISDKYTIFPMYRYYTQTASKYFYEKDVALSTQRYYTSDYDLSKFYANQYGFGVSYKDIFTTTKIWKLGLKSIDFRYNHYERSTDLKANILSLGSKFILE